MGDVQESSLSQFVSRLRAGDPEAWREFDKRYGRFIRMTARARARRLGMSHITGSEDITQSVYRSLTEYLHRGGPLPECAEQLRAYLACMTRNRVVDRFRGVKTRGHGRIVGDDDILAWLPGAEPDPVAVASHNDMIRYISGQLSDEERVLVDLKRQGRDWPQVAAAMGGTPDKWRMRYDRLIQRYQDDVLS
jgi:DNA-directed RNA polymerase specialized sigma24 family protein